MGDKLDKIFTTKVIILGNLYPDEAETTTMLGAGDLSSFPEDDVKLREADIEPFAPSSVPTAAAPAKCTRLRFMSSTQRKGHDAERRSPAREAVLDHLERWFANVFNVVEALREEVRNSERERKESDKVREEQHKELVRMIQTL
ncbi:hypothetical protein LWI29_020277 [Acer saccharum]|uniref:Uncharacterized protein n=1 Tax=Acer saccharum TaxID=4024 RepID=A0AA39RUQ1_ACESA|nr:hypothetical protein LWI29_020277 [Acer saccharum]